MNLPSVAKSYFYKWLFITTNHAHFAQMPLFKTCEAKNVILFLDILQPTELVKPVMFTTAPSFLFLEWEQCSRNILLDGLSVDLLYIMSKHVY